MCSFFVLPSEKKFDDDEGKKDSKTKTKTPNRNSESFKCQCAHNYSLEQKISFMRSSANTYGARNFYGA